LNEFTKACFEAALWSECDENEIFFDDKYNIDDFSLETKNKIISDCANFLDRTKQFIPDNMLKQAGHDFWLSRNGHGAGFFDDKTEYYGNAEKLQDIAAKYPAISLAVDSDNKICHV
jgi:hypothetical protein